MLDDLNYLKNWDTHQYLKSLEENLNNSKGISYPSQFLLRSKISQVIILTDNPLAAMTARLWKVTCSEIPIIISSRNDFNLLIDKQTLLIVILTAKSDLDIEIIHHETKKHSVELVILFEEDKNLVLPSALKKANCLRLEGLLSYHSSFIIFYRALLFVEAAIKNQDFATEFQPTLDRVTRSANNWGPMCPTDDNLAKQLAYEVIGKTPVIYAEPLLFPVALKWKFNINYSTRQLAWAGLWSASNQLETDAWSNQTFDKNYIIFYLYASSGREKKNNFEKTSRRLSGKMPRPWFIEAQGDGRLEEIIWLCLLADFFSLYSSFLNNAKPFKN